MKKAKSFTTLLSALILVLITLISCSKPTAFMDEEDYVQLIKGAVEQKYAETQTYENFLMGVPDLMKGVNNLDELSLIHTASENIYRRRDFRTKDGRFVIILDNEPVNYSEKMSRRHYWGVVIAIMSCEKPQEPISVFALVYHRSELIIEEPSEQDMSTDDEYLPIACSLKKGEVLDLADL